MDDETELFQRVTQIGNELALARGTAHGAQVPGELCACLDRLCDGSQRLRETCLLETDRGGDDALAARIVELETMAAHARELCHGDGVERLLATGLGQAHDDLRDLRRQLHR